MAQHSLLNADDSLNDTTDEDAEGENGVGDTASAMDAALAERLQLEELAVNDAETAALALQYAEYSTTTNQEPGSSRDATPAETRQPSPTSEQSGTPSAKQMFDRAFNDGFRVLPTPATNLRCGLYAIILSYKHQYPSRTNQPNIETLMEVVNSHNYRQVVSRPQIASNAAEANIMAVRAQEAEDAASRPRARTRAQKKRIGETVGENIGDFLQNDRYFSPDQLDLLLRLWGETNSLRLRLGYILNGEATLLGRGRGEEQGDVVWIHFRSKGSGHYSGLAAKTEQTANPGGKPGTRSKKRPAMRQEKTQLLLQFKPSGEWTRR